MNMKNLEKKAKIDEIANLSQENDINQSRKINKQRLNVFIDWFEEGAASTINFLVARLKLIKSIIDSGNSVTIEENPILILRSNEDLKKWIKKRFDESLIEDVYES